MKIKVHENSEVIIKNKNLSNMDPKTIRDILDMIIKKIPDTEMAKTDSPYLIAQILSTCFGDEGVWEDDYTQVFDIK